MRSHLVRLDKEGRRLLLGHLTVLGFGLGKRILLGDVHLLLAVVKGRCVYSY